LEFGKLSGQSTPPYKNLKALDVGSGLGQTMTALEKKGFDVLWN
jgi:2-polyprenyl-3-methyl-5-hydroxy-6-metoxy-1,4-benzoquinol methylase